MTNWVDGTDGRYVKENGCKYADDCFSCPFDDCKVRSCDLRGGRIHKRGRRETVNKNPYKARYYEKHREEILERARLKKLEKKRAAQVI